MVLGHRQLHKQANMRARTTIHGCGTHRTKQREQPTPLPVGATPTHTETQAQTSAAAQTKENKSAALSLELPELRPEDEYVENSDAESMEL